MFKRLNFVIWKILTHSFFSFKFNNIGKNSIIISPIQLDSVESVIVGNNTNIAYGAWLMGNSKFDITLRIGDNCSIGHFSHIIAKHCVSIENNVLIADKVFITDCKHNYEDINTNVIFQGVENIGGVLIGEGSWIGENVCVIGAKIGKHSVIGANSVVTSDIPDFSVAVGVPARVIKKYNFDSNVWEKIRGE